MKCDEFVEAAAGWLEGDRPDPLRSHLITCEHCRAALEDLGAISQAGQLLRDTGEQPSEGLWRRLRAQLEAEGLIRDLPRDAETPWRFSLVHHPLRGLAIAAFPILAAAALIIVFSNVERTEKGRLARTQGPAFLIENHLAAIERQVGSANSVGNSAAINSLRHGLNVVDDIIHDCKDELQRNPTDNIAQGFLFDAYQDKAWILQTISEQDLNAP
jgi:hypothetical protein